MRGMKADETPIVSIYYNHIRPHQSLDGRTPAEEAGLGIAEKNKWLRLITDAQRSNDLK